MSKRAAMKATLIHLLVVLSLVIESNQSPIGSLSEQGGWLSEQLHASRLTADETFGYLNRVRSKSQLIIGGTNVEQLLELNRIESANCRDGSFARRMDVCEQARSSGISNLQYYCADKLNSLTELCYKENTSSEAKPNDAPVDQVTVDFFKSLFKDTGSQKLNIDDIEELLMHVYNYHGGLLPMKSHCLVLKCSGKQSGPIGGEPGKQLDGDHMELDSQQPIWTNAYDACKYYLEFLALGDYDETLESVFYRTSVAKEDKGSPHSPVFRTLVEKHLY